MEETIWFGPMGSPGMTISSPVASTATRGLRVTRSHGTFIAAASPMSRAVSTRPGLEQRLALLEVEPRGADIAPGRRGAVDDAHDVVFGLGVLLDHDRVGTLRHRRAGEDAHGFARRRPRRRTRRPAGT